MSKVILKKRINIVLVSALVWVFLSTQVVAAKIEATQYNVLHVKENDNLNVRAGAGVGNEVVTTIPFDGGGIELIGDEVAIGKTRWALIRWKGVTGWVSKYYLTEKPLEVVEVVEAVKSVNTAKATEEAVSPEKAVDAVEANQASKVAISKAETSKPRQSPQLANNKGVWILQCGNKSPYWKVELHPKWMNVIKADYETGLHITKKKQEKNRWNTALKTVVHGRNGQNNLKMTIKYAYAKRCYDTLSGLRVPYKVTTQFNGEELTGCCRAVKLDAVEVDSDDTKLTMK